jgi:hypothetical protein
MSQDIAGFSFLVTVAACVMPLFGQVDSSILRGKYGPPVEEVFELRPGIALTVLYGENHQVCKMEVRPNRSAPSVIPASFVQQLVDEVLPATVRGTPKRQFMSITGAYSAWKWDEYEGVTVGQTGNDVKPNPDLQMQNSLATIQFKSCQAPKQ